MVIFDGVKNENHSGEWCSHAEGKNGYGSAKGRSSDAAKA
jgi:hypothetical protein